MRQLRFPPFLALFVSLLGAAALAEEDENVSNLYRENYRFTLIYTSPEDQQTSVEFVTSARSFEVSTFEPRLVFSGTILSVESGSLVLQYALNFQRQIVSDSFKQSASDSSSSPFQTMQTVQGGLKSNVRLEYGAPVDILKAGADSARLVVTKLD